jgi:hypothetical protein
LQVSGIIIDSERRVNNRIGRSVRYLVRTPCPHFAHTCLSAGVVQGGRDGLQIVVEQAL